MTVQHFLESLSLDREFQLQVSGHHSVAPCGPRYLKLELDEPFRLFFEEKGITHFYRHQAEAVELTRRGKNVVLMTPTASGKSLAYNIPVLESIKEDSNATALYLFPLKGLEQDQVSNLNALAEATGLGRRGEVYDGDTSSYRRRKIRESLPNIIFTNPDMLHLAIIPFHKKWEVFYRHLRYVVIDEIHSYRGVFGSHVAQILRRLKRVCAHYGSDPQYIAASATIANPGKLTEDLTGLSFEVVRESGAPSAGKHFFFITPIESPYTFTVRLFTQCMHAGIRTIVFTKSRRITELIYSWTLQRAPELRDKVSPYRAGFLPKERREIEGRLFRGELLGVVSTSALELGVDIGGLDCCILCGYPGSVSSTWQRAGRVGRQGQESLVVMVAVQDALDQYMARHSGEFFLKSHEAAVVDTENRNILKKHLSCAAAELPLKPEDRVYDMQTLQPLIRELVEEKALVQGKKGGVWFSNDPHPQEKVNIRAIGERFVLVDEEGGLIGELSGGRVSREAFPGAVYLHRGTQYCVTELDLRGKKAVCKEVSVRYYTQPLSRETTEILEEKKVKRAGNFQVHWGRLRITQKVVGFDKKRTYDRFRISTHALEMPEYVFETEGLWTVIDSMSERAILSSGFDLGGTLHAVEHSSIACLPLFALCDRRDLGGLSHTRFPCFERPAIFIYDGHEGGVGLTRRALEVIPEWLRSTLHILRECPCEEGCPSCVQDPDCGNRNHPLDKKGAEFLLQQWVS